MNTNDDQPSMYEMANQFINLANKIAKEDKTGTVGAAIRYAAARYNAFEASLHYDDLVKEKETIAEQFTDDYRKMININIDEYSKLDSK